MAMGEKDKLEWYQEKNHLETTASIKLKKTNPRKLQITPNTGPVSSSSVSEEWGGI